MIYTVKRIDEDLDFGCEERPKGMPVMAIVTLMNSSGEETDERVAGQRNQIRIMVKAGDQGRTEKKNPVKAEAEKRAKPKNSVEIPMLYYFPVGECRDEPAFLNSGGDE